MTYLEYTLSKEFPPKQMCPVLILLNGVDTVCDHSYQHYMTNGIDLEPNACLTSTLYGTALVGGITIVVITYITNQGVYLD